MNDSTPVPGAVPPARQKEPNAADRLRQLWLQGQRPNIVEFLAHFAPLGPAQVAAVLRVDQGYRWQSGERIAAETYLRQHPEVAAHAESALDLIYGEYLLRERNGEDTSLNDLLSRFPEHAAVLSMQVELHHAIALRSASPHKPEAPAKDPRVAFAGASGLCAAEKGERVAFVGASGVCAAEAPQSGGSADTQIPQEGSAGQASEAAPTLSRYPNATEVARSPGLPVLAGYDILAEIGRGGMSVVYQARQKGLNRKVALKMLLAGSYAGPEERARFHTEAEALGRFQHPHIVPVYEVGEQDGRPYLVMEYIEGSNLARHLLGTPLTARQAAQLVEQLARAIHFAHQRGIVHRDLKPANILLTVASDQWPVASENQNPSALATSHCPLATTNPKITDFGLAKLLVGEGGAKNPGGPTQSGTILGTPGYMAPEQAAGGSRDIGPAADIYALGAILYELLTGRPPFRAATPLETLLQVQADEPVPPSRLCPRLPRDLATICLKCLEKEPRKRYGSAEALAEDLGHFLAGEPIQARPVGAMGRTWRWCRRKPALAGLIGAVSLLAVVITTISLLSALWLHVETDRAHQAERKATERLFHLSLAQARALRRSGRMGQRFESLKVLTEAAHIARRLHLDPNELLAVRREAIACLALVDLGVLQRYPSRTPWAHQVAFDVPLERYAWSDARGTIHIQRVADDQEITCLPGTGQLVNHLRLRFSADGRFLAVNYWLQQGVRSRLWDLAAKTPRQFFREGTELNHGFSPDGRWFVFNRADGSIGLSELATGKEKRLGQGLSPFSLAFRPDGGQLAVCAWNQSVVTVLDGQTGTVLGTLSHPGNIHSLAWSRDGRLLAAGCIDTKVYVWDVPLRRRQAVLEGHQKMVRILLFHPSSDLLASTSIDGTTRLWDPISGRPLVSVPGAALGFSPDGRRLAFHDGPHLGLWKVADGRECQLLHHGRFGNRMAWLGYKGPECAEFSPDGRLLASAGEDGVRLWDRAGQELAHLCIGRQEGMVFDRYGTRLFTYGRTGLQCWPIRAQPGAASATLQVGPPQVIAPATNQKVFRACSNRDGRRLAVSDSARGGALLVNLTRPVQHMIIANCPDIHSFALSPDGRLLAIHHGIKASGLGVWETANGRLLRRLPGNYDYAGSGSIAFSPDGRWLVVGGRSAYRFWEVASWKAGPVLRRERWAVWGGPVAFSPDGRTLALAHSSKHFRLFDLETRQELATLSAPDVQFVRWLCFSPDGSQLAAVVDNHVVQLWDLRALRRPLRELGLDWERPAAPAAKPPGSSAPRVAVIHHTIEAEYFPVVAAGDCNYSIEDMDPWGREKWSNGHQLLCTSRKRGFVEFEVVLPRTGRYTLEIHLTQAPNYGLVEVSLDGLKVGKVFDGFLPGTTRPTRVDFGTVVLREGSHRLRFTAVDKNPKSVNFFMGIDCLTLIPVN